MKPSSSKPKRNSLRVGDIVKGTVTGIQPYGIFLNIDADTQGLIHISECATGFVSNIHDIAKLGDELRVKVIDIDEYTKKISLSLRVLADTDIPPFPAQIRHKYRPRGPKIGFATVAKAMPGWIKKGLNDIHYDDHHIETK